MAREPLIHANDRVVVLGASGFIGSRVYQRLNDLGFHTDGLSSADCDLLDPRAIASIARTWGPDVSVVFCSAIRRTLDDSFGAFVQNASMVHNFLDAVEARPPRSLVFFSSVDVYGRPPKQSPTTETSPVEPTEYYGVAKLADEMFLRIRLPDSCPTTILRIPGIYGATDKFRSVVGTFMQRVLRGDPVELSGDGTALRDYVEVDDLAEVVRHFVEQPRATTVNVATGHSVSIAALVELVGAALGCIPTVRLRPDLDSKGDIVFDVSHLRSLCPELELTDIERGIRKYAAALPTENASA